MSTDIQEKIHQMALSQVKGLGYRSLRRIMAQIGTAKQVFQSNPHTLLKVPSIGHQLIQEIGKRSTIPAAQALWEAHTKADIQIITAWEPAYPKRLKQIPDAPPLLYVKGQMDLSSARIVGIVGTRKATAYGNQIVERIVQGLTACQALVVSGLAYGIDIQAHKAALQCGLSTVAVMANGLDYIYPQPHQKIALAMQAHGGLLSEHPLQTKPEAHQFAARNRIIAGLADVTIVVEAGSKSGAMITAQCANDYHREVCAIPGPIDSAQSVGCHQLIKEHQAHLVTSAEDIIALMGWQDNQSPQQQRSLLERLSELTQTERQAVQMMEAMNQAIHIDTLSHQSQIPLNQLAAVLLQLELKGLVKALPGKQFQLRVR